LQFVAKVFRLMIFYICVKYFVYLNQHQSTFGQHFFLKHFVKRKMPPKEILILKKWRVSGSVYRVHVCACAAYVAAKMLTC
jgi:hypothetical protein